MKKKCLFSLSWILIFLFVYAGSAIGAMPPTETGQKIIIPYSVVLGDWWTGLAIHNQSNTSMTYSVYFYDKDGQVINGTNVTIPAYGLHSDLLQNYAAVPGQIEGVVSVYIVTGPSTETFSATLFVGNTSSNQGFGFQTYWSQDYTYPIILPPL